MNIDRKEIITNIHENFIPVDVKTLDSKKRINLGEKILKLLANKFKANTFKVYVGDEGDILLRPVVTIPEKEAWVYENPEVLESIRRGLSEAAQEKGKSVEDLETFFEEI